MDGDMGSRWSSAFTDPQIFIVDLGGRYRLDDIVIYWEAAYAREYYLKISDSSAAWVDVRHETNGTGGMEAIPVGATASRVMMAGIQRATPFGYSLYELQVHGSPLTGMDPEERAAGLPQAFSLHDAFPNPFNPTTVIRYDVPATSHVRLGVYDLLGREVALLVDDTKAPGRCEVHFAGGNPASGAYLYRLMTGKYVETRKMVLAK